MRHKRTVPGRRKRLLMAVLLALAVAGTTGAWAYGRSLNSNLARTDAFAGLSASARPTQAVTAHYLAAQPTQSPSTSVAAH